MSTLVIESQYFGVIDWYKMLFAFSDVKIEQCDNYQKMSFRNRCVVAGAGGPVSLSVPLENGRDQQRMMKDTRISYAGRWQAEHRRTLESCYSRSPFYEYYRDDVERLIDRRDIFLLDKNIAIFQWLQKALNLPANWTMTDTYLKSYPPEVLDKRDAIVPKNYQHGFSSMRYTQVFEDRIGFQPNLSILDLLFCTGSAAQKLLSGSS